MKKFMFLVLVFLKTGLSSSAYNVDSLIQRLISVDDSIVKVNLLNKIAKEITPIDYDKSIYFSSEALFLARKLNYTEGISNSLERISYSHYYRSNYTKAMENYLFKIKLDDSLGLRDRVARSNVQVGNIYFLMKDYIQAKKYYSYSLEIFKELQDNKGLADVYLNLGNISEGSNEIQKAEQYYQLSLDIYFKINDAAAITIVYNNLGNIYYLHYKNKKAHEYFVMARNYLPKVKDMTIHVLVYNNYGDYHLWLNNIDSATYYLNKGYSIAENYSISLYKSDIASSLCSIYVKKKDYGKAFKYQTICKNLNDSLFNSSLSSKLAFLDYQYKLEKIENLNTIEKLNQQRKAKTSLWISILLLILVGSVGVIAVFYQKQKIKTKKILIEKLNLESSYIQNQLDLRNKEIVIIMMNLVERNELIRKVIQRIRELNLNLKRADQKSLDEIVNELKSQYQENIINEFEYRFKNVHNNFYDNLIKEYPSLTSNDLRLCAFLKMNMNTKDIAIITHQTTNSIEVARTRLRKKLYINNQEIDIMMFLSRF